MYKHLAGAIERIQFQHASPLYKALIDLFQEIIDTIADNGLIDKFSGDKLQDEIANLLDIMKFPKKLKDIAATYLNHIVDVVYLVPDAYPNAAILIGYEFNKNFMLHNTEYYYKYATSQTLVGQYKNLIDILVSNTDVTSGKLRENIDKYFKSSIMFTTGNFTVNKVYRNIEDITAAECASTIIHEFGHAMTYLESLSVAYQKAFLLNNFIKELPAKLDASNVNDLYNAILHEVNKVTDMESRRKIDLVLEQLRYSHKVDGSTAITLYAISLIMLSFAGMFYADDVFSTDANSSYFERVSDEFVDRHGAADADASCTAKLYSIDEIGRGPKLDVILQNSLILTTLVEKFNLISNVLGYGFVVNIKKYDSNVRRLQLMAQNANEELKDSSLPAEIRDQLVETIRRARAIVAEYESRDYVKAREWFWGSLLRISRPGTTLQALVDGNLAADYQRLQEVTKDLVQSPFSYHAARLQTLKDKNM